MRERLILAAVVITLLACCLGISGCYEEKSVRQEHRTITEAWSGSITVPAPTPAADGSWSVTPTQVPFALTKTTEESSDGTTHTQSGIDPAAIAQVGGALAASLKQAFPVLGAFSKPTEPASAWMETLLGGSAATTLIGGGLAALKHRQATKVQQDNDEAWEAQKEAEKRAAAAEARLAALSRPTEART